MHIAVLWLSLLLWATGCATRPEPNAAARRPFDFRADTFSFTNELVWEYRLEGTKVITSRREPPPAYTHHCFVMVRAARQFFDHARFDPAAPPLTNYQAVVREIRSRSPRKESCEARKVVVPGYANLRAFSRDHAALLQAECGGAWQSYFQRGHWRMVFPFTRKHQKQTAAELVADLQENRPPIVHIVRFPSLAINHVLLLHSAETVEGEVRFQAYDPNYPHAPTTLTFREKDRRFFLPANDYFPQGGRVDVYPVFTGALY